MAWQASDEQTKNVMRGWGLSLSWVALDLRTNLSSGPDVTAETVSKIEVQPAIQVSHQLQTPTFLATGLPAELQEQLKKIENNIADVQGIVEKLAATQAQMGQDIASLQGTEQNIVQKLAAIIRSPGVHVPPHKNIPRAEPSEATRKSLSLLVTAPPNRAPLYLH